MDPASIVEVTEQTQFCPQTDGQKDGRRATSIPPTSLKLGYENRIKTNDAFFQYIIVQFIHNIKETIIIL